jgi:hypothetical protein
MDKRYQVFVSSTFTDLKEERKGVIQTLLEMDCIPAGMELFPATDEEQWEFIKKIIDDCDYYLLIIGGRYGSLAKDGISYTEKEFDYAKEKGIEIIGLLHENPGEITVNKSEQDAASIKKLEAFREKVKKGRLIKSWNKPEELSGLVAKNLNRAIRMHPAVGWVRANLVPSESVSAEILRLQSIITDLESQLGYIKTNAPAGTDNLSQGDELFDIRFTYELQYKNSLDMDFLARRPNRYSYSIKCSWNDIFSAVSPIVINEANEEAFVEKVNKFISDLSTDELHVKKGKKNDDCFFTDFQVNTSDFDKIKIQLRALGLIAESKRNRSIKDTDTYWTLTPYGDTVMTRLLAIKKENLNVRS